MHNLRSNMRLALPPSFLQPFTNCSKKKKQTKNCMFVLPCIWIRCQGSTTCFYLIHDRAFRRPAAVQSALIQRKVFMLAVQLQVMNAVVSFFFFFFFSLRTYFTKNCWLYPKSCCRGNCSVRWPFWFQNSMLCGNPSPINPAIIDCLLLLTPSLNSNNRQWISQMPESGGERPGAAFLCCLPYLFSCIHSQPM